MRWTETLWCGMEWYINKIFYYSSKNSLKPPPYMIILERNLAAGLVQVVPHMRIHTGDKTKLAE